MSKFDDEKLVNEKTNKTSIKKEKFNSVTNSAYAENQNQGHNVKKEALGQNTKK